MLKKIMNGLKLPTDSEKSSEAPVDTKKEADSTPAESTDPQSTSSTPSTPQKKRVTIVENLDVLKRSSDDVETNNNELKKSKVESPEVLVGLAPKVKINLRTNKLKEDDAKIASSTDDDVATTALRKVQKAPIFQVNDNPVDKIMATLSH